MGKPVNTKEDRQRRLDDLKKRLNKGMGIRAALADMGYTGKSAGQQYRQIRNFAQANDPKMFIMLPAKISESDEPINDGMPNKTTTTVAEHMENMKDAADEFFDRCEEMGLKVNGEQVARPVQPVTLAGLEITAVNHQDLGEFYLDKKYKSIDWRVPGGDEVSLAPSMWIQLLKELPNILKMLGVEV